jgi:predicted NUDIX family phosphoesterase
MDALRKKYPVAIQEILDLEQEIKIDSELDLANDDDDVLEKLNFLNRASSNIVEIHKRNTIAINNMWVYDTIADPLHDTDNK